MKIKKILETTTYSWVYKTPYSWVADHFVKKWEFRHPAHIFGLANISPTGENTLLYRKVLWGHRGEVAKKIGPSGGALHVFWGVALKLQLV